MSLSIKEKNASYKYFEHGNFNISERLKISDFLVEVTSHFELTL